MLNTVISETLLTTKEDLGELGSDLVYGFEDSVS